MIQYSVNVNKKLLTNDRFKIKNIYISKFNFKKTYSLHMSKSNKLFLTLTPYYNYNLQYNVCFFVSPFKRYSFIYNQTYI